jgi:hypothetical protein
MPDEETSKAARDAGQPNLGGATPNAEVPPQFGKPAAAGGAPAEAQRGGGDVQAGKHQRNHAHLLRKWLRVRGLLRSLRAFLHVVNSRRSGH